MNKRKIIFAILTLGWMVFIFLQSAMVADASNAESSRVGYYIAYVINPRFSSLSEAARLEYVESISFFIRKAGHMAEYAILMSLLMGFMYKRNNKLTLVFSIMVAFLYACSDEIHQLFVPGRAGRVLDVFIDLAGAAIGMLMVLVAIRLCEKIRSRGKKEGI